MYLNINIISFKNTKIIKCVFSIKLVKMVSLECCRSLSSLIIVTLHNTVVPITEYKKKEISIKQILINNIFKLIKSSGVKAFFYFISESA